MDVCPRPDGFHIRPYAVIPLSLLPAVLVLLGARRFAPGTRGRTALSVAVAAITLLVLADDLRPIGGNTRELRGSATRTAGSTTTTVAPRRAR